MASSPSTIPSSPSRPASQPLPLSSPSSIVTVTRRGAPRAAASPRDLFVRGRDVDGRGRKLCVYYKRAAELLSFSKLPGEGRKEWGKTGSKGGQGDTEEKGNTDTHPLPHVTLHALGDAIKKAVWVSQDIVENFGGFVTIEDVRSYSVQVVDDMVRQEMPTAAAEEEWEEMDSEDLEDEDPAMQYQLSSRKRWVSGIRITLRRTR